MRSSVFHISVMALYFQGFISLGKYRKRDPVLLPFIVSRTCNRRKEHTGGAEMLQKNRGLFCFFTDVIFVL